MDTTLTIFISKTSNLVVSSENLADSNKNLAVSTSNVDYEILREIINKSLYKSDVKDKLLKILNSFYNSTISNKDIQDKLSYPEGTARNCINYLKDLDIIEPITGQGKGKYKFK